jgi:hypothetical protein
MDNLERELNEEFAIALRELEDIVAHCSKDINNPLNLEEWIPHLDFCRKNTDMRLVLYFLDFLKDRYDLDSDAIYDLKLAKGE